MIAGTHEEINSTKGLKLVVIFREMAGYISRCLEETARQTGREVVVFCLPVNPEAPFDFGKLDNVRLVNRSGWTAKQLENAVAGEKPDLVFVADWTHMSVLQAAKKLSKRCTLVTGFDNHWTGSFRQRIMAFAARFVLGFPRIFRAAFVPGSPQAEFAHKLGFSADRVLRGAYTADVELYRKFREQTWPAKQEKFPRRLLCVARYIPQKGLSHLWDAFVQANRELGEQWELHCAGTGEQFETRMQDSHIRHLGFVQPADMGPVIAETGVFVLPSIFEPWGVVAHEYAVAGYPLLLSHAVGAAEFFLKDGVNGYSFEPGNTDSLKQALLKIMRCSDEELRNMATESIRLGEAHSPAVWAKTLLSAAQKFNSKPQANP